MVLTDEEELPPEAVVVVKQAYRPEWVRARWEGSRGKTLEIGRWVVLRSVAEPK